MTEPITDDVYEDDAPPDEEGLEPSETPESDFEGEEEDEG